MRSVFFSALFVAAPVCAQTVYKWTDARGVTHYTATPPPAAGAHNPRKLELNPERNSVGPDAPLNAELQQQINERTQRQRAAREEAERARAEAEKRAGLQQWQAEQDALLVAQCKREGKSYCDDAARIRAAQARHQRLQQKQRHQQRYGL